MIILKEIYEDLSVESGDIQLYEDLTVSLADSAGLYLGSADEQLGSADEQYKATPANILIDEVRGGVKKSGTFGPTTTFGQKSTTLYFCFHSMQEPSKHVKTQ